MSEGDKASVSGFGVLDSSTEIAARWMDVTLTSKTANDIIIRS